MKKLFFLLFIALNLFSFELSHNTKIVSDNKNPSLELKKYLDKILNTDIKITNSSQKDSIIIQKQKGLKKDSFKIEFSKDYAKISASNDRGLFYGVYFFLQKAGVLFLTKDVEVIPKFKSFRFKNETILQIPRFDYREYFASESEDISFSIKLFLNGRLGHRVWEDSNFYPKGRKIYNEFSSKELLGDEFECNGQYEFDNQDVVAKAKDKILQKLSKLDVKSDDYIYLQHEDRRSFCKNRYTFFDYVNTLAKEFDYNFLYEAYEWSSYPPKEHKVLADNLSIFFSTIDANFAKPLNTKENQHILKKLQSWDRLDRDIIIWDYVTNFGGYFQPTPNIYSLDKDLKTFAKFKNVKGIFLQGSYTTLGSELIDLRIWVFSKLLWNPNQDINKLIKKFCDNYYHEASPYIQKYVKAVEKLSKKTEPKLYVKSSVNLKYLDKKYIDYLEGILNDALKTAKTKEVKKRVLKLFSSIDYVRVIRAKGDKKTLLSRKRFKKFVKEYGVEEFAEGASINDLLKIINLNRKVAKKPKIVKNRDWFEYQEYQLKLCCVKYVKDPKSSDGVVAVMPGSASDWGFQLDLLNLPKGKWDVYASVKVKKSKSFFHKVFPAIKYGVDPSQKGVYFVAQLKDNKYQDIKIATIDTTKSQDDYIWLAPPANKAVKALYVDRFFIVRAK